MNTNSVYEILEFMKQNLLFFLGFSCFIAAVVLQIIRWYNQYKQSETLVQARITFTSPEGSNIINELYNSINGKLEKNIGMSMGWQSNFDDMQAHVLFLAILMKQYTMGLNIKVPFEVWMEAATKMSYEFECNPERVYLSLNKPNEIISNYLKKI